MTWLTLPQYIWEKSDSNNSYRFTEGGITHQLKNCTCCATNDYSSEYSNFPNNSYRTKQGKFHLLINTRGMHSVSILTTEIPLFRGDRHSHSHRWTQHYSPVFIVCLSLTSRCDTFARNSTKESLTQFPHHGLTIKKKQWRDTQWDTHTHTKR